MPTATKRQKVLESFSRIPGHLIRRVHQASTAYFVEECGGDLTAVQYAALVAIGSHPGIDATRLSQVIYFDRSTIGDVLDRIESKGWIVRESTASDRRIKLLALSPAGQEVLRQVAPAIRRVQERLLAPLTQDEAKTIVRLLAKMADAGDDEMGAMSPLWPRPPQAVPAVEIRARTAAMRTRRGGAMPRGARVRRAPV